MPDETPYIVPPLRVHGTSFPEAHLRAGDTSIATCILNGYTLCHGMAILGLLAEAPAMLAALKEIAKTPLWGERIADEDMKNTLAEIGEYDLDHDEYNPSGDAEHEQLRDAVETARAAVAALEQSGNAGGRS